MKTSHFITPRSLSDCQFTVGSYDSVVEPCQWVGNTYMSYNNRHQIMTDMIYVMAVVSLIVLVVGIFISRFL
jgi:hypothetical protein